jgi:hypothetical protein
MQTKSSEAPTLHSDVEADSDKARKQRFVKAVDQGLMDVREGRTVTLEVAKKLLGVE